MTDVSRRDRSEPWWVLPVDAVLHSYSIIYFSQRRWMGLLLLLCTFTWPVLGLVGLGGLLVSLGAALLVGFDRSLVRDGTYLFNSLLISLALGYVYASGQISVPALVILLATLSVLTLLSTVGLSAQMSRAFGLPSISLPFVASQLVLFFLLPRLYAPTVTLEGGTAWALGDVSVFQYAASYLRSFGDILFLPHVWLGALVFVAILLHSRLMILYATVSAVVGMVVLSVLPLGLSYEHASHLTLNFVYCGIALGGVFFVPSRGTLLLVVMGAAVCAGVAGATVGLFAPLGFAPVALPLNVVILLVVYVMHLRTTTAGIQAAPFPPLSPEGNFRRFHTDRARFPESGYPTILCPFSGERVITQGFNGPLTHRREWRHAVDCEVLDGAGQRYSGPLKRLNNFYTFNTPVLAPAAGTVIRTIDHIDDRPIGSNNFANPWGNLVILRLDTGPCVKLCHLRRRSLCVSEGQRVKPGDILGYCGNSGRSPVPHLHVQVQTSPQVGATTIPFRIGHYLDRNGRALTYHAAGIPDQGERIQGALTDTRIARCFDNILRRDYIYRVHHCDKSWHETITCHVSALGSYVFESSTGDRLTASVQGHVFYALEYEGGRGVLYWLRLGLGQVPFIANPRAQWHDAIDIHAMLRCWARPLLELTGPFVRYRGVEITGSFEPAEQGNGDVRAKTCVMTTFRHDVSPRLVARGAIPQRIRTYVSESDWVVRVVVDLESPLIIEQI